MFFNPLYRRTSTTDVQNYGTGLSQDTLVKIDELRRLINKYLNYHMNPDAIIQWAIHSSLNGNNTFLDDKVEQLPSLDSYNCNGFVGTIAIKGIHHGVLSNP